MIIEKQDISTPRVKRLAGIVVAGESSTKDDIRRIVSEATAELVGPDDPLAEAELDHDGPEWRKHKARVVWLYVACTQEDAEKARWVCRTQWIDPRLTEYRPMELDGDERMGDIIIQWLDGGP